MDAKYAIGDKVYIEGDDSRSWFIIGVVMRPSYDLICWTYHVGRATYGDYPMSYFGSRCDVDTKGPLREEQISTEGDFLIRKEAELKAEIEASEKRLAELRKKL